MIVDTFAITSPLSKRDGAFPFHHGAINTGPLLNPSGPCLAKCSKNCYRCTGGTGAKFIIHVNFVVHVAHLHNTATPGPSPHAQIAANCGDVLPALMKCQCVNPPLDR